MSQLKIICLDLISGLGYDTISLYTPWICNLDTGVAIILKINSLDFLIEGRLSDQPENFILIRR